MGSPTFLKWGGNLKISACLITKNEENNVRNCLQSIFDIVDEIIVVDTGSTDKTVQIVKEFGAKVIKYTWNDDFSGPRNLAKENAHGDWIIFLDADEYFSKETARGIPSFITQVHKMKDIDGILCARYNLDQSEGKANFTDFMLRIFRNRKSIRYKGKIHESLNKNGKQLNCAVVPQEELLILHTGYSSNVIKDKVNRNLRLLLKEYVNGSNDNLVFLYLSDCYSALQKNELSIKYAKMFIDSGQETTGYNIKPYQNIITSMINGSYPIDEVIIELKKTINKFPKHPLFHRILGRLYFINKNYSLALKECLETLELYQNYNSIELDNTKAYLSEIYYHIGIIYKLKNNHSLALEYLVNALKIKKHEKTIFLEILSIIKDQDSYDIIFFINSIYDENSYDDVKFLVNALSEIMLSKVLLYYHNKWIKKFDIVDNTLMFTMLSNHNYLQAYKFFKECYLEEYSEWAELYSVISAVLSKERDCMGFIKNIVSPTYEKIINILIGESLKEEFTSIDLRLYLELIKQIALIGEYEFLNTLLNLKKMFSEDITLNIADQLLLSKFYNLSIKQYKEYLKNNCVSDGKVYFNIGYCFYYLGHYQDAFDAFQMSINTGFIGNEINDYLLWVKEKLEVNILK